METKETIGEYLKRVRKAYGYNLEDVSRATKINLRYLEAIEMEDFSKLPGDTFLQGFIRSYARFLGIDEKEIVSKIKEKKRTESPSIDLHKVDIRKLEGNDTIWKIFEPKNLKIILPAGAGVIILLFVILLFGSGRDGESIQNSKALGGNSTGSESAKPAQVIEPVSEPFSFKIYANAATWIQAEIDEGKFKDVLLKPGDIVLWRAEDKIVMTIGNAGGIEAEINGNTHGPFGKSGEVVRDIIITSSGLSKK